MWKQAPLSPEALFVLLWWGHVALTWDVALAGAEKAEKADDCRGKTIHVTDIDVGKAHIVRYQ